MASKTKHSSNSVTRSARRSAQTAGKASKDDKPKPKERVSTASGWISKFLKRPENGWLEEVDGEFLKDMTNLMGLEDDICFMSQGLHAIQSDGLYLDTHGNSKIRSKTEGKYLEAAEILYGLIHVRYILTEKGLEKVYRKYKEGAYGNCPRHYCQKTSVLPIGMSNKVGQGNVKIYCPSCQDVYHCSLPGDQVSDGAYFGTSLPQMFFMTYPGLHPAATIGHYEPRLMGFKLHASTYHVRCEAKESKSEKDKNLPKSPRKHSRSKMKTKPMGKFDDDSKENDATQDNKIEKLPQINGHVAAEVSEIKSKKARRRQRRLERNEVEAD